MKLTDLISLSNDLASVSTAEAIAYLQKAYYIVVDAIKLEPGIFPILIKNEWSSLQKFDYKAVRVGVDSEIAFKQVRDFIKTDFSQDNNFVVTSNETNHIIVGYPEKEFFGFEEADYDAMNAIHTLVPEVFQSKQYYHLKNIDDLTYGYMLICAYQYPYPVHTVNGPFIDEYRYNIQWMVTEYGIDELDVDDVVGMLMILKANQLFKEENLDIGNAKHFDYICMNLINLFNENKDNIHNNRLTTLAMMNWN